MRTIICGLLLIFSFGAGAQTPMRSFTYISPLLRCSGDQLMPLDQQGNTLAPPAAPAGGFGPGIAEFPRGSFRIRSVCVTHQIIGSTVSDLSYAVAGHHGVNGNDMTPRIVGSGHACKDYPADAPILFSEGEYVDVHAACSSGSHWAALQIWFTD